MYREKQWANYSKPHQEKCLEGICCVTRASCGLCWVLELLPEPQESPHFAKLQGLHIMPHFLKVPSLFPFEQTSSHWLQQRKKMLIYALGSVSFVQRGQHRIISEAGYLGRERLKDLLLTLCLVQGQTQNGVLSSTPLTLPFLLLGCPR